MKPEPPSPIPTQNTTDQKANAGKLRGLARVRMHADGHDESKLNEGHERNEGRLKGRHGAQLQLNVCLVAHKLVLLVGRRGVGAALLACRLRLGRLHLQGAGHGRPLARGVFRRHREALYRGRHGMEEKKKGNGMQCAVRFLARNAADEGGGYPTFSRAM